MVGVRDQEEQQKENYTWPVRTCVLITEEFEDIEKKKAIKYFRRGTLK